MEKEMAPHSSTLAWKTPWMEEPGGLQSMGSQRVGHNRSDPTHIHASLFFACGSSAPVSVEHEGSTAAWLEVTLVVPNVQGHRLPPPQELWLYQSLFSSLL